MSTKKISDADAATALDGTEVVPGSQSGGDVKITADQIAALAVALAPATSARNVIEPTDALATGLTVQGAEGSSVPNQILQTGVDQDSEVLSVRDENDAEVATLLALLNQTQLTLRAAAGQPANKRILRVLDENGSELYTVNQEPDAVGATREFRLSNGARVIEQLDFHAGVIASVTYTFGVVNNTSALQFDVFNDLADATNSYTTLTVKTFASQTVPAIDLRDSTDTSYFSIGRTIPTSDPHIVGRVWNSSGTLKISAGP